MQKQASKTTILLLMLLVLFVGMTSSLHPLARNTSFTDSSVFILIGGSMHDGLMPYRDLFDHKGPLLYLINYLGLFLGTVGIWVIELMFLVFAMVLCFISARRFFDETSSLLASLATFISIIPWYVGGNLPEVYALPFMFGALYCLMDYFTNEGKLQKKSVFIAGACMGGVLLLKANMLGLWIGLCATIFIHSLLRRKYREVIHYVIFFLLGVTVALIPFIIWLAVRGLLGYFWEAYVLFNIRYSEVSSLMARVDVLIQGFKIPIIFATFLTFLFMLFRKIKEMSKHEIALTCGLLSSFLLTLLITTMGGRAFAQYYMMFIPCMIVPIAYLIDCIRKELKIRTGLLLLMICILFHSQLMEGVGNIRSTLSRNTFVEEVVQVVKGNTDIDDSMIVIGNTCSLYNLTGLPPATRFPYQFPILLIDSTIKYEVRHDIRAQQPRVVVHDTRITPDVFADELEEFYQFIFENHSFRVYLCGR